MDIQGCLEESKEIQNKLLDYLDIDDEQAFQDLIDLFAIHEIGESHSKLKQFLLCMVIMSNNHHRSSNFYFKIFKILLFFKNNIISFYSNKEIFNIFKDNKRILLFLIDEQIMIINNSIVEKMSIYRYKNYNYDFYFYPEIKNFVNIQMQEEYIENFEENRKKGENESTICELVRNDMIIEFIIYINKTNYPIKNGKIIPSIFETNLFLMDKHPSIIEYSAFFGSVQIFQYLLYNDAELTPSLWLYATHGSSPEIIHLLEELQIEPYDSTFTECAVEALKCYHYNVYDFIMNNLYQHEKENLIPILFENYNFKYIKEDMINQSNYDIIFKFDYVDIAKFLLDNKFVDINQSYEITICIFIIFFFVFCFL